MPRISIGLPIYNGEKYVKNRLDNILSQTFQDFEIIIYDNSNDSTPKICREYAQNDDRIDYVHEKKDLGGFRVGSML
jgi:glycosyltransferase involved in cell wall biosynthesis